ncbi:protein-export membrane protein SecF [Candidatus Kaiserbacteria bacterium RIFCSPHIGHO2_01_FULL_51_33]|uniref:Protein-export membrane protein SecF n=1 Tax=Candidatus Kaiserbacteria bacterium RIFCSPLOWO2_01_FULL_51_21 TaxID=1798508 RepID=A0A1F6EDU7_9BACT|nr:MAG: protein-export membrane protein SecF [Candidatus Kaiserbacteria bacterium RIFCSPHIGHO2_01_FULL_51_33]OGG71853.1 MAG: protein-export membrane protein SecF [Candidatus Kaiserbacteria bacterium RIFCSPLOWO2_01_FULL_51_21]
MFVVKNRKIFYAVSAILIIASIASLLVWGLKFGIDFTGGSLLEIAYPGGRPDVAAIQEKLTELEVPEFSVRPTGGDGIIIRTHFLSEEERKGLMDSLSDNGTTQVTEKRFDSIGPTLSSELVNKALLSVGLVILAIVLFITFAFRKVSEPVSSWKYGIVTVVALLHDVIVPTGVFAFLGHFAGYEVDTLFVTALLVILGFSVHDTIVVFDRVRENLRKEHEQKKLAPFDEIVGRSIRQTFNRSVNTSLTTVLALLALYFLGSEATQHFSLVLLIGIIVGTYSSIFIASPLLVTLERWQKK